MSEHPLILKRRQEQAGSRDRVARLGIRPPVRLENAPGGEIRDYHERVRRLSEAAGEARREYNRVRDRQAELEALVRNLRPDSDWVAVAAARQELEFLNSHAQFVGTRSDQAGQDLRFAESEFQARVSRARSLLAALNGEFSLTSGHDQHGPIAMTEAACVAELRRLLGEECVPF